MIGDLSYRGSATIWYSNDALWNYAYKIRRTNEHCLARQRRDCTKTYRVR